MLIAIHPTTYRSGGFLTHGVLKIGYHKGYHGNELSEAVALFSEKYPNVDVQIMVGSHEEQTYYETIIGLKGEFLFADTMQEARLKIITEQGYLPVDVIGEQVWFDTTVSRIPLTRNGQPVKKTYCAFWKKDNSGYYVEEFAELLKNRF